MSRARDVKVGLFVLLGLVLTGLCIFLIGDERRLFNSFVTFRAEFADVQGLKPDAPIRMGGIDIGHTGSVGYGKTEGDTTIYVEVKIVKAEASRIKLDSKVRIATKGLLGDKMLEVTKGENPTSLPPGEKIATDTAPDLFQKMSGIGDKADDALADVRRLAASLADEKLQKNLHESVASVNIVLKQVAEGDGYPHRFLTDKAEAERISRTIDNLDRTAGELAVTLAEVRKVAARVQTGPGFAHDVIYGDGPKKQVEEFGSAAREVAATLEGIRTSNSFAHDVLYGGKGDGGEALANVTAISGDLRAIVANMRAGKGTLGALLVDPSVYDDMKMLLGNVERNDVLRALVRYSIKQDEKKPAVQVGAKP